MVKLAFSKPTPTRSAQRMLFDLYRGAGFDGLQLKTNQYVSYLDTPAKFQDEWGNDPAHASSLITMNRLDEAGRRELLKIFGFAAAIGSERIVLCHDVPRDRLTNDDLVRFAATLSKLGMQAADRGLRLSLHHHAGQPVMHRRDFDVFFDAVEDDAVSLTVDTGHLMKSGILDIAGLIKDFRPIIDNVHLKDYARGEFRILGRGVIDFDDILSEVTMLRQKATLCVDEESKAEITESLAASREFLVSRCIIPLKEEESNQ